MFGNQFICSFEPEANLDKEMVLHQGYLLGGSCHGHDSIFLLNCYGVRWQMEVKQTHANAMSVIGPVWSDFVIPEVIWRWKIAVIWRENTPVGMLWPEMPHQLDP
ncbi:hypothetical protein Tco_1089087 [Tanacetum coccineum]